ncbi:NAD-dependent epimerase/dehydratase family protein [Salinirubellus salinus]|uniref:NAD-dependent epimerase/dehydratase family protein n=1 Tax=Salinirubellus salinus TaxID=1364945 RepID=A0A9E7R2H7_9EURY|nr:NAD-dependent epimerase/dehydratase family protein [Salinirubellus salinus]UWM54371.1 NAD-dependent epimerase/dehydratase family protein [Salinirubellus salinus]
MPVVVTGAPGWLGTRLVEELDRTDQATRCLVLEGEDTAPLDPFDVEFHTGDVRDPDSLEGLFDGDVQTVFHCAGLVHSPDLFGADLFYDVNTHGTEHMLAAASDAGAEHFVFVSSNAAQGFNDSPSTLMTEEMPCRPESDYGLSKYRAEQAVRRYGEETGLDYTIVRPCWYYGPRQPARMNRLMRMIQSGNPLVFGNGRNLRSMTYVPKLVEALLTIQDRRDIAAGETYWIADRQPYTTDYIYHTIADCLGADTLRPIYIPTPVSRVMEIVDVTLGNLGMYEQNVHVAGEMSRHIACDPSKAMDELDWEPPTDLYSGIEESVEWARQQGHL